MPSHTAAEQGEAELRILDFKTTWSEFQKPSQTAAEQGKDELLTLDFKTTWSEFKKLPHEMKPSYIYTILKDINSPESVQSSCVCQHT